MKTFTLPAFAKINWQLKIIGKRDDGFHDIFTIFQTISLHDNLTFSEADKLELTCNNPHIPTDNTNLILKAATELQKKFNIKKGAKIHLEKNIPSPGGLGGGSSDCAVALIGLAKLWEIDANIEDLKEIGSELGSDVPFFFTGGTAIGSGRGNIILPIADIEENFMIIVTPNVDVSTAEAYKRLGSPNLTIYDSNRILKLCHNEAKNFCNNQFVLFNDFEETVFEIYPEIKCVKNAFKLLNAKNSLLSGSGASVFGVFDNLQSQQNAVESFANESFWQIFPTQTVSRKKYWNLLNLHRQQ